MQKPHCRSPVAADACGAQALAGATRGVAICRGPLGLWLARRMAGEWRVTAAMPPAAS
jgi:hypothetical protein